MKARTMWILAIAMTLTGCGIDGSYTQPQEAGLCDTPLEDTLTRLVDERIPESSWGAEFLETQFFGSSSKAGNLSVALQANDVFVPASNTKLLTTAAALATFGSDFRFTTHASLSLNADGTHTLRIRGTGDPSIATDHLRAFAAQLKERGVAHISHLLIEDETNYPLRVPDTWTHSDFGYWWGAPVGLINLNENLASFRLTPNSRLGLPALFAWETPFMDGQWTTRSEVTTLAEGDYPISFSRVQPLGDDRVIFFGYMRDNAAVHVGYIPVRDPALYFGKTLMGILAEHQITTTNLAIVPLSPAGFQGDAAEEILAVRISQPLIDIIRDTNVPSNNLYAEALVALLADARGVEIPAESHRHEAGLNTIPAILEANFGVPRTFALSDGSGLSRHNLVSPRHFTTLLNGIYDSSLRQHFLDTLPVAARTGTLRKRFKNTHLEGLVHAKTGSLAGVSTTSGYVLIPGKTPLIFSVMINGSLHGSGDRTKLIDDMVVAAELFRSCAK